MRSRVTIHLFVVSALLLMWVTASRAATLLSLVANSNGVYTLQGSGLADVGGIDVTINYDATTFSNPRVSQGGLIAGAMMAANPNLPGAVRIVVVNATAIAGNGPIAVVTFDRKGESAGKITSVVANLVSVKGVALPVQTNIIGATAPTTPQPETDASTTSSQPSTTSTTTPTTTVPTPTTPTVVSSPTSTGAVSLGGVTVFGEPSNSSQEKGKQESRQDQTVPYPEPSIHRDEPVTVARDIATQPSEPVSPATANTEKRYITYKSVLQQFKEFTGERSPKAFMAIFSQIDMKGVNQSPPILLTEGAAKVKVSIELPAEGKSAPNFALRGAKLVSLRFEGENRWLVEAMPAKNVTDVYITVMQGNLVMDIPLVVAPKIDSAKTGVLMATDKDFEKFLKDRGSDKAPRFDLNNDKVRNYLDDYIYTANYLVQKDKSSPTTKQK